MSDVKRYSANVFLPGCLGPVKREVVLAEDADKLEAEAQALREEVVRVQRLFDIEAAAMQRACEEIAALRARVVVTPERLGTTTSQGLMDVMTLHHHLGWNACLDELARLNGKAVGEGLLRRIAQDSAGYDQNHWEAVKELRALLGEEEES